MGKFRRSCNGYSVSVVEDTNSGIAIPLVLTRPDHVAIALSGAKGNDYAFYKAFDIVKQFMAITGARKLLTA